MLKHIRGTGASSLNFKMLFESDTKTPVCSSFSLLTYEHRNSETVLDFYFILFFNTGLLIALRRVNSV